MTHLVLRCEGVAKNLTTARWRWVYKHGSRCFQVADDLAVNNPLGSQYQNSVISNYGFISDAAASRMLRLHCLGATDFAAVCGHG